TYAVEIYRRWAEVHDVPEAEAQDFQDLLRISAMLHDIGKAGIPEAILKKPGKLSPEEYEIVKRHVLLGACFFENPSSDWDALAREIALNHHERWDGTGYPGVRDGVCYDSTRFGPGKKGREIPLSARIVAVADVYDALVSERPYKDPWEEDRALHYLRQESGKHFDPEIVDIFLEVHDLILAARRDGNAA
ncbi:MAG TPA: HD domain-containing phosphohydrolase, partial [Rectinemataceae bacterium]|nr:HD domain-containing phosphohydrolase [Rectinemataceae bacterium]